MSSQVDPTEKNLLEIGSAVVRNLEHLSDNASLPNLHGPRSDAHGKGTADVVTDMDLAIESALRTRLADLLPGSRVIGEEFGGAGRDNGDSSAYEWIVDPIDGTINFSRGIPPFTMAVLLQRASSPLLGVVYEPLAGTAVIALAHQGCYRLLRDVSEPQQIHCAVRPRDQWLCSIALSASHDDTARRAALDAIDDLLPQMLGVRVYYGQAFEAKALAEGSLDAVITLSSAHGWTRGVAKLLCREAGGVVMTVLPPRSDMHRGFVLAASDEVARTIASALLPLGFTSESESA